MKYVLINRKGIVVDILDNSIRYIKLLSSRGATVACEKDEGSGVIGSDSNTHYTLIQADATNSPDAVQVVEFEEIPSEVRPGYYKLDNETHTLVYRYTLAEAQSLKQEDNKVKFAEYLASHPLTWVDGKEYGITEADQSEIALNLTQYQIAASAQIDTPTLEWHAKHEENHSWSVEDLSALSIAITKAVYPKYHLMQQYKTAIYSATTIAELEAIELVYE